MATPHPGHIARTQLFVDPKVQGALMLRAILYSGYVTLAIVAWVLLWRTAATGPSQPFWTHFDELWHRMGAGLMVLVLMLPIILIDLVRLSNRFVGPLFRMRGAMRQLACGQPVEPLQFRKGDFWHEIGEEFNAILARVNALEQERDYEANEATIPR